MKKWITYVIVAVVVVAVIGGVLIRNSYLEEDVDEVKIAEMGDSVSVHYTGWLYDDRIYDSRRVFDSSQEIISEETTVTFNDRTRGDPFRFTVGQGVIDGWSEQVVGMREGQTKVFQVPPEKAYDTYTDELIFEIKLVENIPVYYDMHGDDFFEEYDIYPYTNLKVTHPFWGWDVYVEEVQREIVILRNSPQMDTYYNAYKEDGIGWTSTVTSIDSNADEGAGRITIRNNVDLGTVVDAQRLASRDDSFGEVVGIKRSAEQQASPQGVVVEVADGTVTIDFNEEVAGKTLTFKITILEITKQE